MKKLTVVFLACLILFCTTVVLAETAATPILFRDIEWGSTYNEAQKGLPDNVKLYDLDADSSYLVEEMMTDERRNYFDGHVAARANARSSSLRGIKIAGYELSGLTMCFAWTPGTDGLIVEDAAHTALYYAVYEISPKDLKAAYADLTTKLSSIYGEPVSTKESGTIIDQKYTIWNGADNTMLVLLSKEYSSGSTEIEIRYGTTEGNIWLQQAYDALILKETQEAASSVDGL